MLSRIVMLFTIAVCTVAAAVAHQGHQHQYLGTVERNRPCHFVMKTREGETKTIFFSAATRFEGGAKGDLAVGRRLSVYVENDGETAVTVKVGGAQ